MDGTCRQEHERPGSPLRPNTLWTDQWEQRRDYHHARGPRPRARCRAEKGALGAPSKSGTRGVTEELDSTTQAWAADLRGRGVDEERRQDDVKYMRRELRAITFACARVQSKGREEMPSERNHYVPLTPQERHQSASTLQRVVQDMRNALEWSGTRSLPALTRQFELDAGDQLKKMEERRARNELRKEHARLEAEYEKLADEQAIVEAKQLQHARFMASLASRKAKHEKAARSTAIKKREAQQKQAMMRKRAELAEREMIVAITDYMQTDGRRSTIHSIFKEFDKDGSGGVGQAEFTRAMARVAPSLSEPEVHAVFASMEAPTNPGRIGFKELRLTIKRLSRQYWAELRKREVDGTDEISALMNQHRDRVLAEAEAEREAEYDAVSAAMEKHRETVLRQARDEAEAAPRDKDAKRRAAQNAIDEACAAQARADFDAHSQRIAAGRKDDTAPAWCCTKVVEHGPRYHQKVTSEITEHKARMRRLSESNELLLAAKKKKEDRRIARARQRAPTRVQAGKHTLLAETEAFGRYAELVAQQYPQPTETTLDMGWDRFDLGSIHHPVWHRAGGR